MRHYTTLGTGKQTKILIVEEHQPARTLTTANAEAAGELARALEQLHRKILNAIYPVAIASEGTPIQARRYLLGLYDAITAGETPTKNNTTWAAANRLVTNVANAATNQPAAVTSAVRKELAEHLHGLDGVLVPARFTTHGWKRACLDVCISGALHQLGDDLWVHITSDDGKIELEPADDDPGYPTGGTTIDDNNELVDILGPLLWHAEPVGTNFTDTTMAEIYNESDQNPGMNIRTDHFLAWIAHHAPDHLDAARTALN